MLQIEQELSALFPPPTASAAAASRPDHPPTSDGSKTGRPVIGYGSSTATPRAVTPPFDSSSPSEDPFSFLAAEDEDEDFEFHRVLRESAAAASEIRRPASPPSTPQDTADSTPNLMYRCFGIEVCNSTSATFALVLEASRL